MENRDKEWGEKKGEKSEEEGRGEKKREEKKRWDEKKRKERGKNKKNTLMLARTTALNASLISHMSMSSFFKPVIFNSWNNFNIYLNLGSLFISAKG